MTKHHNVHEPTSGEVRPDAGTGVKLGTFPGVFTPSILTILGIILFLRTGFVVGNAGLLRALLVIAFANSISILTSFSLAAIATNFRVRGGGDYYLISRSLGPEFGGAIGLVLFIAQSVSVAFYAIGFAEGVAALLAVGDLDPRWIAGGALLPLFALAWLGANWATRFQYVIMTVLFLAIGSFAVGALAAFDRDTFTASWSASGDLPFWTIFALFFPAVTGFTQGVSMSGDLRDPATSLPQGTFLAVGLSIIVYFGVAVLFAGSIPGAELVRNYDAMRSVAAAPWLISAGLFAATLSSALASFLSGPRILRALAADKLFRFLNPFRRVTETGANPRRAVLLAFAIALITVAVGNLNVVAPVVSMFFLISYGLLNYATYYEARAASPSFRPRFRGYHPWLSLAGCLACGGAMLAIDPVAGVIAFVILMGIHEYLRHAGRPDRWADGSRSALFEDVRHDLLAMTETTEHDRDWRPVILVLSDDPPRRERIIRFASWIEGGSGMTTAVRLHEGEGVRAREEGAAIETELRTQIHGAGLEAFARVVVSPEPVAAFGSLIQGAGIGPIRPNLALFNWFDHEPRPDEAPAMRSHGELMRTALRHGCSLVVLSAPAAWFSRLEETASRFGSESTAIIDVWWDDDASSRLSLLLAYLMTRRPPWARAQIRVLAPPVPEKSEKERLHALRRMLDEVRISAVPVGVPDTTLETVARLSADSSFAFVTGRMRDTKLCDRSGEAIPPQLEGYPPTAFVHAIKDIALDSQPDEGPQAEAAKEQDALEGARVREERARTDVAACRERAGAISEQLAAAREKPDSADEINRLERLLEDVSAELEDAEHRVLKAEAQLALHDESGAGDAPAKGGTST